MSSLRFTYRRFTLLVCLAALAAGPSHTEALAPDSAAVAEVIHAFHTALASGDSAAAAALLSEDVHIAESGGVETKEEYLSHHLPGDMAFAAAVTRVPQLTQITVQGDVAWAMSTSHTEGRYRDRDINALGAELVVLARGEHGWLIRAIHWSSRQGRGG